jgi:hypothetical protein
MMAKIFDTLFGCWHSNYTFPITARRGSNRNNFTTPVPRNGTYVVCLDCGKEFPYDWKAMKIISPSEERARLGALATKEAA